MAPVVDKYVDWRHVASEVFPECSISLVADENLRSFIFVCFTLFPNVNPIHHTIRAEVAVPHLHASPAEDADLGNMHLSSYKFFQMPFVNIKIVHPFDDASAIAV